jgi:hypothetical protein
MDPASGVVVHAMSCIVGMAGSRSATPPRDYVCVTQEGEGVEMGVSIDFLSWYWNNREYYLSPGMRDHVRASP